jgi:hypothetical protein
MSLVLQSSGGGSVTIAEPTTASNFTQNLPAADGDVMISPQALTIPNVSGTVMVSGNMPAFSAYSGTGTTLSNATFTKVLFDTENFDTNNNYASSRFTPTVAGYYQINAGIGQSGTLTSNNNIIGLYRSGIWNASGSTSGGALTNGYWTVSGLFYMDGSTDYVEVFIFQNSGSPITTNTGPQFTFSGCLVRSA